jgi:V-type H+-transporting ATPase subunit F
VTGLLLAGVGHITDPPDAQKNFLVVDAKTEKSLIESTFNQFTRERKDIGIVLINQHVRWTTCSRSTSKALIDT